MRSSEPGVTADGKREVGGTGGGGGVALNAGVSKKQDVRDEVEEMDELCLRCCRTLSKERSGPAEELLEDDVDRRRLSASAALSSRAAWWTLAPRSRSSDVEWTLEASEEALLLAQLPAPATLLPPIVEGLAETGVLADADAICVRDVMADGRRGFGGGLAAKDHDDEKMSLRERGESLASGALADDDDAGSPDAADGLAYAGDDAVVGVTGSGGEYVGERSDGTSGGSVTGVRMGGGIGGGCWPRRAEATGGGGGPMLSGRRFVGSSSSFVPVCPWGWFRADSPRARDQPDRPPSPCRSVGHRKPPSSLGEKSPIVQGSCLPAQLPKTLFVRLHARA